MRNARWAWIAVGGLLVVGCQGSEPTVTGTVRLDNEPLAKGAITLVPAEGTAGPGGGGVIKDGKYEIKRGLQAGKYRVEIRSTATVPGRKVLNPTIPTELVDEEVSIIPEEYNTKSTLVREVSPGANVLDFDLKGGAARK